MARAVPSAHPPSSLSLHVRAFVDSMPLSACVARDTVSSNLRARGKEKLLATPKCLMLQQRQKQAEEGAATSTMGDRPRKYEQGPTAPSRPPNDGKDGREKAPMMGQRRGSDSGDEFENSPGATAPRTRQAPMPTRGGGSGTHPLEGSTRGVRESSDGSDPWLWPWSRRTRLFCRGRRPMFEFAGRRSGFGSRQWARRV